MGVRERFLGGGVSFGFLGRRDGVFGCVRLGMGLRFRIFGRRGFCSFFGLEEVFERFLLGLILFRVVF